MIHAFIPIIFSFVAMLTLMLNVGVLISYAQRSPQRNILIGAILVWVYILLLSLLRQINVYNEFGEVRGYMSNAMSLSGLLGFLFLIFYGISVLFDKRFNIKTVILFYLPAIVTFVANVAVYKLSSRHLTFIYHDWDELMMDSANPIAIINYITIGVQVAYMLFVIYSVYQLVPIYNRYLESNETEERYNLNWLYLYLIALLALRMASLTITIVFNGYILSLYLIVVIVSFIVLAECARYYKHFPNFNRIKLHWSLKDGWVRVMDDRASLSTDKRGEEILETMYKEINRWILDTQQYANTSFSMMDVVEKFPIINTHVLSDILERHNHTFQSYIREIRINESVRMIKESDNNLRFKEICFKVGFSHYSSFSRAFTSVIGISPSKYRI